MRRAWPCRASIGVPRRTARHRALETCLSGLAAGRAGSLQDGCHPDASRRRTPSDQAASGRAWLAEQSRLVNRMKATLVRLGIRGFNPKLKTRGRASRNAAHARGRDRSRPTRWPSSSATWSAARFICDQIRKIERGAHRASGAGTRARGRHAMVRLLARVIGIGIETADLLVHEVLLRNMRDRRAVGALRRADGLAGPERLHQSRERDCPIRQCPRAARHGPIGLAVPAVPEGQRSGAMVSAAHGECPESPQDHDRGAGPQAADRACGGWCARAWCRRASSCARRDEHELPHLASPIA